MIEGTFEAIFWAVVLLIMVLAAILWAVCSLLWMAFWVCVDVVRGR